MSLPDARRLKHLLPVILIVTAAFLSTAFTAPDRINDDATITSRYVQNFLQTGRLSGCRGCEPVEGYSNPLLLFLTALIAFVLRTTDINSIIYIGVGLNTLAFAGIVTVFYIWGKNDRHNSAGLMLATGLLATNFVLLLERGKGLETILHVFIVFVMVWLFSTNRVKPGIIAALLLSVSRPEGILLACASFLPLMLDKNRKLHIRHIVILFLLPLSMFLLWRFQYFGSFVSNTSIAKTHLSERGVWLGQGVLYLARAFLTAPLFVLLGAGTVFFWKGDAFKHRFEISVFTAQLVFILAVGGDDSWFGYYRFFVPVVPLMFRSIPMICDWLKKRSPTFALPAAGLLSVLVSMLFYYPPDRSVYIIPLEMWRFDREFVARQVKNIVFPGPFRHEVISRILADAIVDEGEGRTLVCGDVGAFPIHWKGYLVDPVGLLSPEFARVEPQERGNLFRQTLLESDVFIGCIFSDTENYVPHHVLNEMSYMLAIRIYVYQDNTDWRGNPLPDPFIVEIYVKDRNLLTEKTIEIPKIIIVRVDSYLS